MCPIPKKSKKKKRSSIHWPKSSTSSTTPPQPGADKCRGSVLRHPLSVVRSLRRERSWVVREAGLCATRIVIMVLLAMMRLVVALPYCETTVPRNSAVLNVSPNNDSKVMLSLPFRHQLTPYTCANQSSSFGNDQCLVRTILSIISKIY